MYKKILQYTLIVAALAVIVYIYLKFSKGETETANPLAAMPANVSFVTEVSSFEKVSEYVQWFENLAAHKNEMAGVSFNPVAEWPQVIHKLDSLAGVDIKWNDALKHSHVFLAAMEQGRGDTWLLTIGMQQGSAKTQANELMMAWGKPGISRDFKGTSIQQNGRLQYAVLHECLVIASTNAVMEDAIIRNDKNDVLIRHENFMSAHEVSGTDAPLHFFSQMDNEEWMQLDPVIYEGKNMLSGYALLNDSTSNTLRLASNGSKFSVAHHLPANTSILDVYSYTDFETGWKMQEDFYATSTASKFWGQAWKDFGDTCQCDLNEEMLSWRSGEWGSAVFALNDSSTTEVLFFRMKDSTDVMKLMTPLLFPQSSTSGKIYHLKYPQLFDRNKAQAFLVETNYITQVGEYVFVAATPGDLAPVIAFTTPLDETTSFRKAIAGTNPASGRFIYQTDYYSSLLPKSIMSMLGGNEFVAASFEHFKENKYLVNIALPFEGEIKTSEVPTEEVISDTVLTDNSAVLNGPWPVVNHNTKGEEKLLQNENKELCLYGEDGKLLWKKLLNGEVLGDVVQIDALKNGKLQYAFTTSGGLYVVDRNGNDLAGFPVLPKPPVQSALHVADYDNNKKYRLLFCAGDDWLANYGVDGKQTTGWKPTSRLTTVFIEDFKSGNDNYILVVGADGSTEILSRTGELKFQGKKKLEGYNGGKCTVKAGASPDKTEITYTNKSGEVKKVVVG